MNSRFCGCLALFAVLVPIFNAASAPVPGLSNQITGSLTDGGGNPITNVQVFAAIPNSGTNYSVNGMTDAIGNYSFSVTNGSWTVGVKSCDSTNCENGLPARYLCPTQQTVNISSNNAVANFLAVTVGSPLPNGTVGTPYIAALGSVGGRSIISASITNGILPPGLSLDSGTVEGNAAVVGTPNQTGMFLFTVEVLDSTGTGSPTKATFWIAIAAPNLQITTTSATGQIDGRPISFFFQLQATNGTAPYVWSLASGSPPLPPG